MNDEQGENPPFAIAHYDSDLEALTGAVARGWCHPETEHLEMDVRLADAIVDEVLPLIIRARSSDAALARAREAEEELELVEAERDTARARCSAASDFKRFVLRRHEDVSGVSGTGIVAEGVLFSNGVVALQWTSEFPTSVVFHQRAMESVEAVHTAATSSNGEGNPAMPNDPPTPSGTPEPPNTERQEGCTCPMAYKGLGILYGVSFGEGWVRLHDDPRCPIHHHYQGRVQ
jgi:hypothetical protein